MEQPIHSRPCFPQERATRAIRTWMSRARSSWSTPRAPPDGPRVRCCAGGALVERGDERAHARSHRERSCAYGAAALSVGGLNIQTTPALQMGATVTLHARFAPDATLAAIATERPSLTVLVPATIQALIEHPLWADTDVSSLRAVTTGSTQVPQGLIDALDARGLPGPPGLRLDRDGADRGLYPHRRRPHAGSTGLPGLCCEARIVDDERMRGAARRCRRGRGTRAERVLRVLGQPGGDRRDPARRLVFFRRHRQPAMRTAISSFTTARRT